MKTISIGNRRAAGAGLLVVLATFALFSPSIGYEFINLDDGVYIAENPVVADGFSWPAVKTAWAESKEVYWAPLLWMSFMLDVELFGLEPWGFHLVNVVLFALNAGLLFWLARRWTGQTGVALAVALLWAFHPARVESVAWVAERKDVLSGLFFLLGLGAYVEGRRGNLRHGMVWAWLCMAMGGMVKQIVVVMPAVLMLLDVWPLGRTDWNRIGQDGWRLALEKRAFWALALALAFLPVWIHHRDGAMLAVSVHQRLAMIPIHYLFYIQKVVWPSKLAVLQGDLPFRWWTFAGGLGIVGGGTWGLWQFRTRAPWALAGWLWFVGTLFPLSGVVWAGSERLATRFLFVPQIGLLLAGAVSAGQLVRTRGWNWRWGALAGVLLVGTWGGLTMRLLPQWRNSRTIHARVLQINPHSIHAFDNLGKACFEDGKLAEWQEYLESFRRERPGNSVADIHYAWWLAAMLGAPDQGLDVLADLTGLPATRTDFWLWVEGRTKDRKLLGSWRDIAGICLRHQGDLARMESLRADWEGKWDDRTRTNFLTEMLYAYWTAGREAEASALARELGAPSSRILTVAMPARFLSRWQQGARGYAFGCFQDYVKWMPNDGMALNNMAWLVATAKPDGLRHARMDEWPSAAVAWAERALELGGEKLPGVWDTLAAARANAGDFAGAVAAAERARALAADANNPALTAKLDQRLAAYRSGQPWRE